MIFCFAAKVLKKTFLANSTGVVGTAFVCFAFQFSIVKQKSLFVKGVIGGVLLDTIICNITFRGLDRLLPRPRNGSL